jgi:hypothetical protein
MPLRRHGTSCRSWRQSHRHQIAPFRVPFFDDLVFPCAPPFLDPLFCGDCLVHVRKFVGIDQPVQIVFLAECRTFAEAVLINPPLEIVGDANIKDTMRLVGENVDEIAAQL